MSFSSLAIPAVRALRAVYARLPAPEIRRPVFILGCGRSGTTILGMVLSKHCKVTYLNERRDIWFSCYPESDVWSDQAEARGGKVRLNADDAQPARSRRLRRLFALETLLQRKPILIEKLPINNFRLPFLLTVFPLARFVHIYRNGAEVARSIENYCSRSEWYGVSNHKWRQLVAIAETNDDTRRIPPLCKTNYQRGLLEWRLSTESVLRFFQNLTPDQYLEISYSGLMQDTDSTLNAISEFIGLEEDPAMTAYAQEHLERRSPAIGIGDLNAEDQMIGGPWLEISTNSHFGMARSAERAQVHNECSSEHPSKLTFAPHP